MKVNAIVLKASFSLKMFYDKLTISVLSIANSLE
jgi:hypothetical protein